MTDFNDHFILMKTRLIIAILCLILGLFPARPVSAAAVVFVIPGSPGGSCTQASPCSLSDGLTAVDAAGTLYAAAGTYTGAGNQVVLLDKTINFYGGWNGQPTGSIVRNPTLYTSILDGEDARRVITITGAAVEAVVDGWTIQNGNASGLTAICSTLTSEYSGCGGGIYVYQADPTISHNIIQYNTAAEGGSEIGAGGGIYVGDSVGTLVQWNTIRYNDSHTNPVLFTDGEGWGGGLYIADSGGKTTVMNNEIYNNEDSSTYYRPHSGSGIQVYANDGQIQIIKNQIHDNNPNGETYWGTGIATQYNDNTLIIAENRIVDNRGWNALGLSYSEPTITRNVIINPGCEMGISQYGQHSDDPVQYAQIINNVIARHSEANIETNADSGQKARAYMVHNTISDALYGLYINTGSDVIFDRGIISNHSFTGIFAQSEGDDSLAVSYTLFSGNTVNGETGSIPLTGAPFYVDPAGYDYHHRWDSDAIDRVMSGGVLVDIDNDPRPSGWGTTSYDVGADEFTDWMKLYLPLILKL